MKKLILLILLMLACAAARAESRELPKMELTSDSLSVAISTEIKGYVDRKTIKLKFGDRGFRAGLLVAMLEACPRGCGFDPSEYIGYIEIEGNLIFLEPSCAEYGDWFSSLPESREFESRDVGLMHDGSMYWNFILLGLDDIVLESYQTGW